MRRSSICVVAFLVLLGVGTVNAWTFTLTGNLADRGIAGSTNGFNANGPNGETWYTSFTGVLRSSFSGQSDPSPAKHADDTPIGKSIENSVAIMTPTYNVPEAGALLLFGTGLAGLVGYRRIRRMR